jgi:hypothetical protein
LRVLAQRQLVLQLEERVEVSKVVVLEKEAVHILSISQCLQTLKRFLHNYNVNNSNSPHLHPLHSVPGSEPENRSAPPARSRASHTTVELGSTGVRTPAPTATQLESRPWWQIRNEEDRALSGKWRGAHQSDCSAKHAFSWFSSKFSNVERIGPVASTCAGLFLRRLMLSSC